MVRSHQSFFAKLLCQSIGCSVGLEDQRIDVKANPYNPSRRTKGSQGPPFTDSGEAHK